MKKQMLDGAWNLSFTMPDTTDRYETEVTVPCNVEPYLVELGLIDDYMPVETPFATQKFDGVDDWTYVRYFDAEPCAAGVRRELVFDGVDTIAEVYLNGEKLLDMENMHLQYRADVTDRLLEKGNEIKVVIRSAVLWAKDHPHDNFSTTTGAKNTGYDDFMNIRKPRYIWGWDNTPRLLTSGIVRSVYIEEIPEKYFASIYAYTRSITDREVGLGFDWQYVTPRKSICDHRIRVSILDGDEVVHSDCYKAMFYQGTFRCVLPRDKVELWWPAGMGEPKQYIVKMEMLEGENVVAERSEKFGIRQIHLDWTEEVTAEGGRFHFIVNGVETFIRGTNWKPLDPLTSLADKKLKDRRALDELVNLHCNMVRIWGGGIYEDEFFFDYCDSHGIMIWQDFMLACEITTREPHFAELMDTEARYIIKKYRNHPSLAVWCGDNENDGFMLWVNRDKTMSRPSHNLVSRVTLKACVIECDPYRDYVPSSPYMSDEHFLESRSGKPLTRFLPEMHYYTNPYHSPARLRENKSIFFGETGPIPLNSISANPAFLERESERAREMWDKPSSSAELTLPYHQNPSYFMGWREAGKFVCQNCLGRDFSFDEFKDYTIAINYLCSEMFKDIIEFCRVSRPEKSGVLWWSLLDMFPMLFNYSVIDSEFNRKLGYYYIRQSQQEFVLAAVRKTMNGRMVLYAINDTMKDVTAEYSITAYDKELNARTIATGTCSQKKNSYDWVNKPAESSEPELWIIKWNYEGKECVNHVVTGKIDLDTMKKWLRVIEKEYGEEGNFCELSWLED